MPRKYFIVTHNSNSTTVVNSDKFDWSSVSSTGIAYSFNLKYDSSNFKSVSHWKVLCSNEPSPGNLPAAPHWLRRARAIIAKRSVWKGRLWLGLCCRSKDHELFWSLFPKRRQVLHSRWNRDLWQSRWIPRRNCGWDLLHSRTKGRVIDFCATYDPEIHCITLHFAGI